MVFGDTAASHNWTLSPGTGGVLTLQVSQGSPTITVTNQTATLSIVLSGTQGFTKSGTGTLVLTGGNTYTGSTGVSQGKLVLGSGGSLGNTSISVSTGATFAPQPGNGSNSAGSTGSGSSRRTLNLQAGSTFDMTNGAVGVFQLNQQSSFGSATPR